MVFSATVNNSSVILWQSALLVVEYYLLYVYLPEIFSVGNENKGKVRKVLFNDEYSSQNCLIKVKGMALNATFNNISVIAVSFICGRKRSTRRKSLTCRKPLTNIMLYRIHLAMSGIRTHTFSGDIN